MPEIVLRSAVFVLAASAAVALLLRHGARVPAVLAAFALAGMGAFAVSSWPGALANLGPAATYLFDAWCLATPLVVWLLAQSVFREDFRATQLHYLGVAAFVAVAFAGDWGRFGIGVLGNERELSRGLLLAARAISLAFVIAAGYAALRHWRDDLVEARRRARAAFVAVVGAVFAALAASDFLFGPAGAPAQVRLAGLAALALVLFAILQAVARGGLDELLEAPPPRPPGLKVVGDGPAPRPAPVSRAAAAEAALARRVVDEMEKRQLWKREGLAIASLAEELRTQEHVLRRAINRHLGYRNFNDFLHDWRLKEAAARLASPDELALPVLTIALDCGYGSIGPFNRAFKARFGLTPTQYRNLRAEERSADSRENPADSGIGHDRRA